MNTAVFCEWHQSVHYNQQSQQVTINAIPFLGIVKLNKAHTGLICR